MLASVVVTVGCLLLVVSYAVQKRLFWRSAMVVMAAAALMVPLTALPSPAAQAQGGAVVLVAHASPAGLPSTGGTAMAIGKVRDATTCRVAVLGDHGVKVSLPKPASCADGQYHERVGFGPNTGRVPVVVKLGLLAGNSRGVFYVVVAAGPAHPAILEARADPWEMPAKGGWTAVIGKVRNARTCHLMALGWKHPVLPSQNCSSGTFAEKLWLSANEKHVAESQAFELVATGNATAVGKFFVRLAAAPLPPPTTTTTAAPVTTTTASPVAGTPPPALVLPPPPPTPPPATTTTTVAPTTTTTAAPTGPTLVQETGPNWSGYAVGGTQTEGLTATAVTGTFTVPQLTYAASCNDSMAVWNGIDGNGNSYLIQAGIGLQTVVPYGPNAGSCTSGQYYIFPWWEVITPTNPAPPTLIETWDDGTQAVVNTGDQVTVTIDEVSSGQWNIVLTDYNPSTGVTETFDYFDYYGSYVSYAGPGASAEWIVEDADQKGNPNCTWQPASGLYLCPMPAYDPSVSFTGLGFNNSGAYGQTDQMFMDDQNGNVVSQPSSIGTNGDFSVSYVGSGTNAPNGAVRVKTLGSRLPGVVKSFPPSLSPEPHPAPR